VKNIYFIPEFNNKIGYGHLKRLLNYAGILKKNYNTIFLLSEKIKNFKFKYKIVNRKNIPDYLKDSFFTIVDFRFYNKKILKMIIKKSNTIIFDSPFIITCSPNISIYINITTPIKYKFLSENVFVYSGIEYYLPPEFLKKKKLLEQKNKIFITFGNSDPNKLTLKTIKILKKLYLPHKIIINIGKYFSSNYTKKLNNLIKNLNNFYISKNYEDDFLTSKYIITSFGLTFLEALLMNKYIALYNNSLYHNKLSKKYKKFFSYLGIAKLTPSIILKNRLQKFITTSNGKDKKYNFKLKNIFNYIFKKSNLQNYRKCPICSSNNLKIVFNHHTKRIYECQKCKTKIMNIIINKKDIYTEKYFTKDYSKQYGKSYINDKDNIRKFAKKRLKIINKLISNKNSLLDIGCAYGFFLEEAKKYFKNITGIEINKEATEYARKVLKLNVINKDLNMLPINKKYDVITLWYVLEHIKNIHKIMNKLSKIVYKNGILAIAIPNGEGALYKFNKELWFNLHPDDHFFDYSIKGIKILAKKYNFKVEKIRITGLHPERVGINNPILKKILSLIFKLLNLGDTMEIYLRKI